MGKPFKLALRLRFSIIILFLLLSLPLFVATVWFNYTTNDGIARDTAYQLIEKARFEAIASSAELVNPIKSLVVVAASLGEAEPEFFRQDRSTAYLTEMAAHSSNISSVYVAFEDGSFRMSLVLPRGGLIQGKLPPDGAVHATRWLDRSVAAVPQDRYTFFDAKAQIVGRSEARAIYDPRLRPWFKDAVLAGRQLSISDPYIFATTGLTGITIAMPFYANGKLAGVAAADVTLDSLSKFLASRPVSRDSLSLIVDDEDRVIAHPDPSQATRMESGRLIQNSISRLSSRLPGLAMASRLDKSGDKFTFVDVQDGKEYVAMFAGFPPVAGKSWRVMIIAPLADFSRKWTENNRHVLIFGAIAIALQVALIYFLSMLVAKPIEQLEKKVINVQNFVSSPNDEIQSRIPEIHSLIEAVNMLDSTIHTYSAFVPKSLVQQLLNSDQRLELGGGSRFLTILSSDIESFSSLAQITPAHELLLRVSAYLDAVTSAVNREQGAINNFSGDGVMAFWGAPAAVKDHAYRACVTALRVQASMRAINQDWTHEGLRPLNVRIGIHSDSVLAGNLGSAERMSYTVMGDGTKVSSQLMEASKQFGINVCITHAVFKETGERLWSRPVNVVSLGGHYPMEVYELVGVRGGDPELEATPMQIRLCVLTQHAYQAFTQGDLVTALHRYTEIVSEYPDDPLCRAMVALCHQPQSRALPKPLGTVS